LRAGDVWQHHLVRDRIDIETDDVEEYDPDTDPVFVVVFLAAGQWVFSAVRLDPIRREYLHIDTFGEDGAPESGRWERIVLGVIAVEDFELWGPGGE